ncbi:hypothetical protein WMF23_31570 [Sorangium sp. So ce542]
MDWSSALVSRAAAVARQRGMRWLHVDFEPHLAGIYRGAGFAPTTKAGLMKLGDDGQPEALVRGRASEAVRFGFGSTRPPPGGVAGRSRPPQEG